MFKRLVVLLVLVSTGCMSYRPSAPLPAPETQVRVSFALPRDVRVQTPTGESAMLRNVTELRGTVIRAQLDTRLDSVRVMLGTARGREGAIPGVAAGTLAIVPRGVETRVDQRSIDVVKTAGVALAVLAVVTVAVITVIALSVGADSY